MPIPRSVAAPVLTWRARLEPRRARVGRGLPFPRILRRIAHDAKSRLALGLEHGRAVADEPHALARGQPHVVGHAFLGDPEVARVARDLEAARRIEPDHLSGGEPHSALAPVGTKWWRCAKVRVSGVSDAATSATPRIAPMSASSIHTATGLRERAQQPSGRGSRSG